MLYTERQEQAIKHLGAFTTAVNYENALTMRFVGSLKTLLEKINLYLPENVHAEFQWWHTFGFQKEEENPDHIAIYEVDKEQPVQIFDLPMLGLDSCMGVNGFFEEKFIPFFCERYIQEPEELDRIFNKIDLINALQKRLPNEVRIDQNNLKLEDETSVVDFIDNYSNHIIFSISFACKGGYNIYEVKAFVKNSLDLLNSKLPRRNDELITKKKRLLKRL
jgi:hypothetical protein